MAIAFENILFLVTSIVAIAAAVGALWVRDRFRSREVGETVGALGLRRGPEDARAILALPIIREPRERNPHVKDIARGVIRGHPLSVFLFWNNPVTPGIGPLLLLGLIEASRTRSTGRRCVLVEVQKSGVPVGRLQVRRGRIRPADRDSADNVDHLASDPQLQAWASIHRLPVSIRCDGRWLLLQSTERKPGSIGELVEMAVSFLECFERQS